MAKQQEIVTVVLGRRGSALLKREIHAVYFDPAADATEPTYTVANDAYVSYGEKNPMFAAPTD